MGEEKICGIFCILMLMLLWSVPSYAQDMSLSLEVPKLHTVTVESTDGRIVIDGAVANKTQQLERHKEQSYRIIPDDGKRLDKLFYNGEDVTEQVKKGVFTAPALIRDSKLEAVFKDAPTVSDDKKYTISGKVVDEKGKAVPDVTVEIGSQTDAVDEIGSFILKEVPSGTHTVVITDRNGKIIGSGEITIDASIEGELILTVDSDGNPIIKPASDTTDIAITLQIDADGSVTVIDASDITVRAVDDDNILTGDFCSDKYLVIDCSHIRCIVCFDIKKNKKNVNTDKNSKPVILLSDK
ncbi:MAG: carboxypeptidase-like regulatory domain-containing protein [Acutalibacteraceae bacterium]